MPEYRPMPGYELGEGWTGGRRRRSRSARVRRWAGPPIGLLALVEACLLVRLGRTVDRARGRAHAARRRAARGG